MTERQLPDGYAYRVRLYMKRVDEELQYLRDIKPEVLHFAKPVSHYEHQVAKVIRKEAAKHLRRVLLKHARKPLALVHGEMLAECLPELASLAGSPKAERAACKLSVMVSRSVRQLLVDGLNSPYALQLGVANAVVEGLVEKASVIDMQCRLPPVRDSKPLTPQEQRAQEAARKFQEWKRRAATAKKKLAAYRRKVTYYKKKGLI